MQQKGNEMRHARQWTIRGDIGTPDAIDTSEQTRIERRLRRPMVKRKFAYDRDEKNYTKTGAYTVKNEIYEIVFNSGMR